MDGRFELNERQELFCRYYVRRPVGAEAARAAGYEPKGAAVEACRLLDRPAVRARIRDLRADVARQHCRDEDTILAKLEAVFTQAIEVHQFHAAAHALTVQAWIARILPERGAALAVAPARPAAMLRSVNE